MKTLFVMRHASASHDANDDKERPLSVKGKEEAKRVAFWCDSQGLRFHHVVHSTALRTTQTAKIVARGAPLIPNNKLYLASAGEILQVVQSLDDTHDLVLLTGHNPGLHHFCKLFLSHHNNEAEHAIRFGMAPADFLILQSKEARWKDFDMMNTNPIFL